MSDNKTNDNIVVMKGITKIFGKNKVLDKVDFELKKGEIHALLGENGAGKTTLMNILYGLYSPNSGEIYINSNRYTNMTPKIAVENGIGMVHQHFMLIEPFSVIQNIVLGTEDTKGLFIDLEKSRKKVISIIEKYGFNIDLDEKIQDITVGSQQKVEILKALYKGAEIIIFDEPTAVLTPQEIVDFINICNNLRNEGKSIIIITHKLDEIKKMADYCTIIRRGKFIDKVTVSESSQKELAEKMVGREVNFSVNKKETEVGDVVLDIKDINVLNNRNLPALSGLSLNVRKGEILGIAGVDGNGQSELIEAITGLRKVESGNISILGKDITNKSVYDIIESGISTIPEDRHKHGLVLDFSVSENMILEKRGKAPFSKNGILNFKEIESYTQKMIDKFDIRPNDIHATARGLSGGNQQKVILAREIDNNPDLLIAAQPTRGLDVGAIEIIHKYIVEQRDKGKAVLLISFELDEVMDLSDRIAVIYKGKIVGEKSAKDANENELGLMMAGGVINNE